jgi:hypothetical protein
MAEDLRYLPDTFSRTKLRPRQETFARFQCSWSRVRRRSRLGFGAVRRGPDRLFWRDSGGGDSEVAHGCRWGVATCLVGCGVKVA